MKFFRLLKTDLYRSIMHVEFVLSVLLFWLLCLTKEGYFDGVNNTSITVAELIVSYSREQMQNNLMLSWYSVFLYGMGSYVLMFAPVIAALPSIPGYCRERSGQYSRFLLPRCNVAMRCISMWLSALITGGLAVVLGEGLFGISCWALFPNITAEQALLYDVPVWRGLLTHLAGMFVFGMVSTLIPILLSGMSRNVYFVLCGAFASFYAYCTLITNISDYIFYAGEPERSFQIALLHPSSVVQTFVGNTTWVLAVWCAIALAILGILWVCASRRLDKGA